MQTSISTKSIINSMIFVWVGHFLVDFMLGIWPVYKTMIQLDLTTAGLIMAFSAIIGEACQPIVGSLSDRGHAKTLALLGVLLAGSAAFFAYFIDCRALGILFLFTYMGSGIFHPSAGAIVGSISSHRRALYMSIFASGGGIGLAISQIIFSKFHMAFNGQTFYLVVPGLCLLLWALTIYRLPTPPKTASAAHSWDLKQFFRFFRHPQLSLLYVLLLCTQSVTWALIFLLPDILKERFYSEWLCYGAGHFSLVIGGAVSVIPVGFLADKYGTKNVLTISSVSGALFLYTFLFFPLLAPITVCILLFLVGACLGVIQPLSIAIGTRLMPDAPGKVCAFLMGMVWIVSESMGPGFGGALTKLFASNAAGNALISLAMLLIIGNFCLFRLKLKESEMIKAV